MRQSFPHRDFANEEAETCWLSCLFQALWHSVVFHNAFEQDLLPENYAPAADEALLAALQQTWAEYKKEGKRGTCQEPPEHDADATNALVAPDGLVDGFGPGYGDMSEALACLQSELSDSTNAAAVGLSERLVLLPLAGAEGALPSPEAAWELAKEWQVTTASLIAVDLSVPPLAGENIKDLAKLWSPMEPGAAGSSLEKSGVGGASEDDKAMSDASLAPADSKENIPENIADNSKAPEEDSQNASDTVKPTRPETQEAASNSGPVMTDTSSLSSGLLGNGHRLVALVCYMHHLQHYVAFCRRQSNSLRCCFFNDLPELTNGVPKEVEWQSVPDICGKYSLTPRLILYECS